MALQLGRRLGRIARVENVARRAVHADRGNVVLVLLVPRKPQQWRVLRSRVLVQYRRLVKVTEIERAQ